jgi:circadian clock protein KaiB
MTEQETDQQSKYKLRLFVTGASPNSAKAITNIKMICDEHLQGNYELEVIDIYQQPLLASQEDLVALPLLIKAQPLPLRKLIGDMSNTAKVLRGLGLDNP